jgi:hypothetical protein
MEENMKKALTSFEYELYKRLKKKRFISWSETIYTETAGLNRLVKKGFANLYVNNKNNRGWKIKDDNKAFNLTKTQGQV